MAKQTERTEANDTTTAVPPARPPKGSGRARTTRPPAHTEPTEEDIRKRAYDRYLERGGGHGMDFEDWLEAERELKGSR
jgi:hypothetical protein